MCSGVLAAKRRPPDLFLVSFEWLKLVRDFGRFVEACTGAQGYSSELVCLGALVWITIQTAKDGIARNFISAAGQKAASRGSS